MKKLLLVLTMVPAVLANAGDAAKSRWRSLTTGNLFEVTDFGDRLSVRFLAAEVVEDQSTERSDLSVSMNGPKEQIRPGRWLLQKRPDGKYVGTANSEMTCTYYRQWMMEWATNVCKFSTPVELSISGTEITGWSEGNPATKSKFDCGKCKWSKTERVDFQWAREDSPQSADVTTSTASPASSATSPAPATSAGDRGVFTIESTPPNAEVYVDGEFIGSTPIEHSLSAGRHQVELRRKGFANWSRWLNVTPGARAKVAAEMEP